MSLTGHNLRRRRPDRPPPSPREDPRTWTRARLKQWLEQHDEPVAARESRAVLLRRVLQQEAQP